MIYIFDYTSRSLPYDKHLLNSLVKINQNVRFVCESATGCKSVDNHSLHGIFKRRKFTFAKTKREKFYKAFRYFLTLIYFYKRFKRDDIIHFQWLPLIELTNFELYYIKMLQGRGVKIMLTVHNTLPHETGLKYYNHYRRVYQLCDHLICHTNSSKEKLTDDFKIKEDKITVIPHGPLFFN
jgi:hypothetical protein